MKLEETKKTEDTSENVTEEFEEIMSFAKLAFYTADFEKAIDHANEAQKLQQKQNKEKEFKQYDPEVYEILAKSYQALGQGDKAISCFEKAIELDVTNGNRYVEIGVAYGSNDMPIKALEAFAKAEELGCSDDYLGGMYRTMAMLDYELGRYDDAAANFSKAQEWLEPDIELLMYKSLAYSMGGNVHKALNVINQIKQFAPSEYVGYSLAYNLFIYLERMEDAVKELHKAYKWVVNLPMDFYFDNADFVTTLYEQDKNEQNLINAIVYIEKGMFSSKPNINDVVNAYLKAADIYIKLKFFNYAVSMLEAAENPVNSFNRKLSVALWTSVPQYDVPVSESYFDSSQLNDCDTELLNNMAEIAASDEEDDYKTEIPEINEEEYILDKNEPIDYNEEIRDRINMLYIAAYSGLNDNKNVIKYAKKVKNSSVSQLANTGRYLEVKAYADMGDENIKSKYEDLIKYYRKEMIKDPSDITVLTYMIQCYIDLKYYDEAIRYCHNLSKNVKEPLLKQIFDARKSEEGN